jgi:streptogramin lyase
MASAGGRYFGFVNGAVLPAAQAAHLLATAWDQNAALSVMSPVASRLRSVVSRWLTSALGLPAESEGMFVGGATVANLCGLAAARDAVLARAGWDAANDGLFGAPSAARRCVSMPSNLRLRQAAHTRLLLGLVLLALLVGTFSGGTTPARADPGTVTEFYVGGIPSDITSGPDGNLWFTDYIRNEIGRMTPQGVVTRFTIPSIFSAPSSITAGPDGNVWFTELNANKIGRITPAGTITEFSVPTPGAGLYGGIVTGADGNIWFAEGNAYKLGRITPSGTVTEFPIGSAYEIALGPDGNIWTINPFGGIGRVTTSGSATWFSLPGSGPSGGAITSGSDGNVWFSYLVSGTTWVGKMTTDGALIGAYAIPSAHNSTSAMTAGSDGNIWIAEWGGTVATVTPSGIVTEYHASNGGLSGIASGPDGNIWFTSRWGGFVGRVDVPSDTTAPVIAVPADVSVAGTSPAGRMVTFDVTARDDVDGPVPVVCTPASGSTFAINALGDATTVTCTTQDDAGNVAVAGFTVHVKGAGEQLNELGGDVDGIGPGASLANKVSAAESAFAEGDVTGTCEILYALIHEVNAQSGKSLDASTADALVADATRIRAVLGCSP